MGFLEANAPSAFQQWESFLHMHLGSFPVMKLARSDDQLEIAMLGKRLLKKTVDLFPLTTVLPRREGELTQFEHELGENGRGNGHNWEESEL